ncbi:MAG: DUF2313 domain-containing protein [Clostridium sp.]|nr:DUF2313 domain-containing protein [Clostridium sp.]
MALIDRLPLFYKDTKEVINIQNALENERLALEGKVKTLINDLFVITSENINEWENFVGIKVDVTKPLEFRKNNVIARIRGKGTTTKELIKNVSESYANAEVDVIENNNLYSFLVKFIGVKGIPENLNDLKKAIEEIKPAHLSVNYAFTYNSWSMVNHMTWGEVESITWDKLRTR